MVRVDPRSERAVALPEREENPGVVDDGLDLEAVSDDPGVREQALLLPGAVTGHDLRIEALECSAEVRTLPEDRRPRKARLVDLEREALEELRILLSGKPYSRS